MAVNNVSAGETRHVVVVVWDGLRPDFVTEQLTPTLAKLAGEGVTFRNHHAVYPSATNVNGTALATGDYPQHSTLIANHIYRADIDAKKPIDVEDANVVQKGDQISGDKYIAVPTIAELVHRAGGRSVIATAKTVGLLLDRHVDVEGGNSLALFAGKSRPPGIAGPILTKLGRFPSMKEKQFAKCDAWTTKALTNFLWKDDVPKFTVLWLSEPDGSQHQTAPGAPAALKALKTSDQNLARVLEALDRHHARETTDVFVVSDHGFSTISRKTELPKILKDAGFHVATKFAAEPKTGDVMMVGNGGSILFYVTGHDLSVTRRLVDFLQQSDFAGVIFSREKMAGTFTLEQGKIDTKETPDVTMAFRWTDTKNKYGTPGMIDADWQRKIGEGTHATLSRFDMHNTLIAAGPDFRVGETDDLASGNVDLAPTILRILEIQNPMPMDGRVLSEALRNSDAQRAKAETEIIEANNRFPIGTWRQYLRMTRVGSTIYFDEGNGIYTQTKTEND